MLLYNMYGVTIPVADMNSYIALNLHWLILKSYAVWPKSIVSKIHIDDAKLIVFVTFLAFVLNKMDKLNVWNVASKTPRLHIMITVNSNSSIKD